jgi:hypothetical protein
VSVHVSYNRVGCLLMAPWTFSIKFPYDTQFTFGSLMFTAREDEDILHRFMDKLHTIWPIHLHQVGPDQV